MYTSRPQAKLVIEILSTGPRRWRREEPAQ